MTYLSMKGLVLVVGPERALPRLRPGPARTLRGQPPAIAPTCDWLRQRGVQRLVGEILPAGEEPHQRPPLLGGVVANRPPQRRIAGLQRVDHGALGDFARDVHGC